MKSLKHGRLKIITLSFRPEGGFQGRPAREQFFVTKGGTVAHRQVWSQPSTRRTIRMIVASVVALALMAGVVIATMALSDRSPADVELANALESMLTQHQQQW